MARAKKRRGKKKYVFTAARKRALKKAQAAAKRSRKRGGHSVHRNSSRGRARRSGQRIVIIDNPSEKTLHRYAAALGSEGGKVTAGKRASRGYKKKYKRRAPKRRK